ncbi:hypothetical protein ACXO18_06815 [Lactobacillus delbrueckii subsp. bulgaricus]|uniref:hypothetical protein n=1 Tax=Lactobacillus delbrueckii TaxID=1584 RepID=UPI000AAA34E7|nr:hypothetical protein [Lactobacillus delbrueckii]MCD5460797.1 hypothetical protein [Lactobacillus delbrueckii subsp. bulgaricus]MCT3482088.1 hypothetical protein [Lactobacillus delbrueckii subsp. bulgaricus]MCT3494888.1 hypothetical protein [Lactobacillus delbrueckii subsp. bulgaricus]MCT3497249.1 hypothetical protein [Lactobacillus delbrueckii subsp. bulgaricus]
MQGKEILTKIQPYIKDNEVLKSDFEKEFGQFTISEQKALIDILSKININIVDFYSQQGNMISGKWFFPSGRDLQKVAAANPAIENFRDNSLSSMTREVCQNSLDAVVDNTKPVTVKFKEFDIIAEDLPGYHTLKEDILPAAKREWLEDKKTQQLINSMENCLNREKIKVLKISDFNTTGLKHGNWESLVEQVGSSFKSDEGSAGSFGIGKAAPFAVSQMWMVFYSTKVGNTKKSIGVMQFVSFEKGDEVTQGPGYFSVDGESKKPFSNEVPFDSEKRTEDGTDIYIIGVPSNWEKGVELSLFENFLVSMTDTQEIPQKLRVYLNDEPIDAKKIKKTYLNKLNAHKQKKDKPNSVSYYEVLHDDNKIICHLNGLQDFGVAPEETLLFISANIENPNRRVLMSRKSGMKIYDQKGFSRTIKFSAIFCAVGDRINSILKQVENVSHDKWSPERYPDPQYANRFLRALRKSIKDAVIKNCSPKIEKVVDAFGVADFLPDTKNGDELRDSDELLKVHPQVDFKENSTISHVHPVRHQEVDNEKIANSLRMAENGLSKGNGNQGGSSRFNSDNGGLRTPKDGKNDGLGKEGQGNNKPSEESDQQIHYLESVSRKTVTTYAYHLIERDASLGKYDLMLKPNQTISDVKIVISVVGDSGNKSNISIQRATINSIQLRVNRNHIFIATVQQGIWTKIGVQFKEPGRLKMEVDTYAAR